MLKRILLGAAIVTILRPAAGAQLFTRADDTRSKPPQAFEQNSLSLELGGAYTEGNMDQRSLNGGLNAQVPLAARQTLYSENSMNYAWFNGAAAVDKWKAVVFYTYRVAGELDGRYVNVFVKSTHGHNRFWALKYRTQNGAGVCLHNFIPGFPGQTMLTAGLKPEYSEYEDGTKESLLRNSWRFNFTLKPGGTATVGGDFTYTPKLTEFANYRLFAELSAQFKITAEKLSFKVSLTDEYDSRPQAAVKHNDFAVNQSIVLHLGQ